MTLPMLCRSRLSVWNEAARYESLNADRRPRPPRLAPVLKEVAVGEACAPSRYTSAALTEQVTGGATIALRLLTSLKTTPGTRPAAAGMDTLGHIKNEGFKSIKSAELEIAPINTLIGANGSGKSNLIEVFELLREFRDDRWREYLGAAGSADQLLHFGSRYTETINIEVFLASKRLSVQFQLRPTRYDTFAIGRQQYSTRGIEGHPARNSILVPTLSDVAEENVPSFRNIRSWNPSLDPLLERLFDSHRVYHAIESNLHAPIKKTAYVHDDAYLRADGSNVAPFLLRLHHQFPDAYQEIRQVAQMVAPFLDDFDLRPLSTDPNRVRLAWKHLRSDNYFDVSAMSAGTLCFIMLAALFLQPVEMRPRLIVFDEPELGLHPAAISLLGALIRRAAVDGRVIVATQSSALVDEFEPADIVIAERVDGATQFHRPDGEELQYWLDDYTIGQLWEKNVLDGNPKPE